MNIGQFLNCQANNFPTRTALVFQDKKYSYEEFMHRCNQFAQSLLRLRFKKGDKVATLLFNCNHVVEVFLGTLKVGGIFTPINFRLVAEEIRHLLDHSDARFLVFGEEFITLVDSIRHQLPKIESFISVGKANSLTSLEYESLLKESPTAEPNLEIREEDECLLMYTSGTTGKPNGVLLTHRNILWNLFNTMIARGDTKQGETSLVIGPLYHSAALNVHFLIRVALCGTSIIIKHFDPQRVLEIIQRERVNVISGAPTIYHMILNLPGLEKYDTRSINRVSSGGSILPEESKRRIQELFPNAKGVYDAYGTTEASPNIAILKAEDSSRKLACVGPPVPFSEVKIVNEKGDELLPGMVGEIICKGPNIMKGYYKDAKATAEAIKCGWLYTGDLGRRDEEGFIYIVDRKNDMINSGGENIYPRETEEVLYRHPKIHEAAVIGVPDPLWGETPKAFVVLKSGESLKREEIIEYCQEHMASYKKPNFVEFVSNLPRNPAGKVLKNVLREKTISSIPNQT